MTVVGVVVVMGLLALVLMRTRALNAGGFLFAAVWGFLLAATPAGPAVTDVLGRVGHSMWQAVQGL
ncbi:MAG TPA: hypothetical protein VKB14_10755 [Actinomycetales bacterium]|nr:hypothetical protein [Actinomycetales bacterium]